MTVNTNFQSVQRILGNLNPQGQTARKYIGDKAKLGELASKVVMGLGAVFVIAAAVSIVAHPILGALGVVIGSFLLISGYDASRLARNVQDLVDDTLSLNNAAYRLTAISSADRFANALLKDTLVLNLGPLRNFAINWLNQPGSL